MRRRLLLGLCCLLIVVLAVLFTGCGNNDGGAGSTTKRFGKDTAEDAVLGFFNSANDGNWEAAVSCTDGRIGNYHPSTNTYDGQVDYLKSRYWGWEGNLKQTVILEKGPFVTGDYEREGFQHYVIGVEYREDCDYITVYNDLKQSWSVIVRKDRTTGRWTCDLPTACWNRW